MTPEAVALARCISRQSRQRRAWQWKAISGLAIDGYQRRILIVVFIFFGEMCSTDSVYHLLSPSESCTAAAPPNETLSLLCVHPPIQTMAGATSTSGSDVTCHFRSVVWRRLEANGETTNVTETRRFSLRRGGGGGYGGYGGGGLGEGVAEEGHGRRVSLLRISGLQPEDLSRYRCDVECADEEGRHFTRHHTVSVCIQQSHQQFAICEVTGGASGGRCSRSFSDGVCDSYCDHESHLFDGFDCVRSSSGGGGTGLVEPGAGGMDATGSVDCRPEIDQKCRPSYADGICDHECDSSQCAWDGGDCIDRPLRLVDDVLVLTVAENFHRDPGHPLPRPLDPRTVSRAVSRLLRTVIRHPTDDWIASHLKDEHPTHQGQGPRGARDRRGGGGSSWEAGGVAMGTGTRIYLKIDNTNCFSRCFDSAETAGKFVSMATRRGWDPGFRITSVAVLQRVTDRCRTLNDSYVIRSSAEDDDVAEASSGEGDAHHRLFGYSPWGTEESKGALVWVVIAAVVGGLCVVMLVFGLAVFAHRISRLFHRRRHDRVARGHSPPGPLQEGSGAQWAVQSRTTSVVGAEKFGTEV